MAYDPEQRRRALADFMAQEELEPKDWCRTSGLSPGALWPFMASRTHSLGDDTYEALAVGASLKLKRPVTAAEIRGEIGLRMVPIRSYVGAGAEIIILAEDEPPIDWTAAPPGMELYEATEVRGRSMTPLYHDGDRLFHRRLEEDPSRFRGEIVVAQVRDGKRFVKLLERGTKRNRFTLSSVNPAFEPLVDQLLDWVGPIEWVHKKSR